MNNKSRNLSVYRYFEKLQFEYIVAELRKKIYPAKKDKNYHEKVMRFKKEKIEDIALRNSLPSIFSDSKIRQEYYQQIYKMEGIPNFFYKDELEQQELQQKDYMFYYAINSEVKFFEESKIVIGVIKSVDFDSQILRIEDYDNNKYTKKLNQITRIL
jgi:hypothetical protein